jgi:hypothetical protein
VTTMEAGCRRVPARDRTRCAVIATTATPSVPCFPPRIEEIPQLTFGRRTSPRRCGLNWHQRFSPSTRRCRPCRWCEAGTTFGDRGGGREWGTSDRGAARVENLAGHHAGSPSTKPWPSGPATPPCCDDSPS